MVGKGSFWDRISEWWNHVKIDKSFSNTLYDYWSHWNLIYLLWYYFPLDFFLPEVLRSLFPGNGKSVVRFHRTFLLLILYIILRIIGHLVARKREAIRLQRELSIKKFQSRMTKWETRRLKKQNKGCRAVIKKEISSFIDNVFHLKLLHDRAFPPARQPRDSDDEYQYNESSLQTSRN